MMSAAELPSALHSRAGCATRAKLANQLLYAKFAQASNPEDVPKGTRCALKVSEM